MCVSRPECLFSKVKAKKGGRHIRVLLKKVSMDTSAICTSTLVNLLINYENVTLVYNFE